eukprot:c12339_g1_i1.p1 GENE.c12339_g1_i1~~c12339_g1_i1.p1  ORF type:complete len:1241 (-),score=314.86 c12339_g1_i1:786-4508(-)
MKPTLTHENSKPRIGTAGALISKWEALSKGASANGDFSKKGIEIKTRNKIQEDILKRKATAILAAQNRQNLRTRTKGMASVPQNPHAHPQLSRIPTSDSNSGDPSGPESKLDLNISAREPSSEPRSEIKTEPSKMSHVAFNPPRNTSYPGMPRSGSTGSTTNVSSTSSSPSYVRTSSSPKAPPNRASAPTPISSARGPNSPKTSSARTSSSSTISSSPTTTPRATTTRARPPPPSTVSAPRSSSTTSVVSARFSGSGASVATVACAPPSAPASARTSSATKRPTTTTTTPRMTRAATTPSATITPRSKSTSTPRTSLGGSRPMASRIIRVAAMDPSEPAKQEVSLAKTISSNSTKANASIETQALNLGTHEQADIATSMTTEIAVEARADTAPTELPKETIGLESDTTNEISADLLAEAPIKTLTYVPAEDMPTELPFELPAQALAEADVKTLADTQPDKIPAKPPVKSGSTPSNEPVVTLAQTLSADIANDTAADEVPAEVPAKVSADVAGDAVADDVPEEAPDESPVDTPVDTHVELPREAPVEPLAETPAAALDATDIPAHSLLTPTEAPADTQSNVPAESPLEVPVDVAVETPANSIESILVETSVVLYVTVCEADKRRYEQLWAAIQSTGQQEGLELTASNICDLQGLILPFRLLLKQRTRGFDHVSQAMFFDMCCEYEQAQGVSCADDGPFSFALSVIEPARDPAAYFEFLRGEAPSTSLRRMVDFLEMHEDLGSLTEPDAKLLELLLVECKTSSADTQLSYNEFLVKTGLLCPKNMFHAKKFAIPWRPKPNDLNELRLLYGAMASDADTLLTAGDLDLASSKPINPDFISFLQQEHFALYNAPISFEQFCQLAHQYRCVESATFDNFERLLQQGVNACAFFRYLCRNTFCATKVSTRRIVDFLAAQIHTSTFKISNDDQHLLVLFRADQEAHMTLVDFLVTIHHFPDNIFLRDKFMLTPLVDSKPTEPPVMLVTDSETGETSFPKFAIPSPKPVAPVSKLASPLVNKTSPGNQTLYTRIFALLDTEGLGEIDKTIVFDKLSQVVSLASEPEQLRQLSKLVDAISRSGHSTLYLQDFSRLVFGVGGSFEFLPGFLLGDQASADSDDDDDDDKHSNTKQQHSNKKTTDQRAEVRSRLQQSKIQSDKFGHMIHDDDNAKLKEVFASFEPDEHGTIRRDDLGLSLLHLSRRFSDPSTLESLVSLLTLLQESDEALDYDAFTQLIGSADFVSLLEMQS